MIDYVKGGVSEITPTYAVIDCNGVGYYLNISLNTYTALQSSASGKLYVHEAIREDAYVLFGFADKQERELFRLLISVSGVGPNTARVILSSFTVDNLEGVIASNNVNLLKSVKGIGAKTAQRIIVDLKDKIKQGDNTLLVQSEIQSETFETAVEALTTLGFPAPAAKKAVGKLLKDNPSEKVDGLIKKAFKIL